MREARPWSRSESFLISKKRPNAMHVEIEFPDEPKKERRSPAKERGGSSVEQQEGEAAEKQALLRLISKDGMEAKQALRIMARYGKPPREEIQASLGEQLELFGLHEGDLSPIERKQCLAIIDSLTETDDLENPEQVHEQLESFLAESFVEKAFEKIDRFNLFYEQKAEPEQLRSALREVMGTVGAMAKISSPSDPNTAKLWKDLSERYIGVILRKKGADIEHKKVFEEVFDEFQDVIEGDLYDKFAMDVYLKGDHHKYDAEGLSMALYGRTKEEVKEKKLENRKTVAQYLLEHKDDEPSIELLQELHRIYNDGIVPKKYANFRREGHEVSFGGKRVGVLGEDVRAELERLIDRTKEMLDRKSIGVRYGMEAAKLHNEMLHIHPFSDRNGSTSMLFLEFLMAKRGYVPQEKKTAHYYDYVRKVVKNNPLAVAVVGAGQYEMVRSFGYFKGETTKGKEDQYQALLEREYGTEAK